MDVKTLISPTARAVRVVDLQKGTVYKRIVKEYSEGYKLVYGVVLGILNGDETFIDVVEVEKAYGSPTFKFTVLGAKSDLNIYPTTKAELVEHFAGLEDTIKQDIEKAGEELAKKRRSLKMFQDITSDNFGRIKNTKFETLELASGEETN